MAVSGGASGCRRHRPAVVQGCLCLPESAACGLNLLFLMLVRICWSWPESAGGSRLLLWCCLLFNGWYVVVCFDEALNGFEIKWVKNGYKIK